MSISQTAITVFEGGLDGEAWVSAANSTKVQISCRSILYLENMLRMLRMKLAAEEAAERIYFT